MSSRWPYLLICAALGPPLSWLSERRAGQLGSLRRGSASGRLPTLSIIIPARNEAANLERLLPSLVNQNYPGETEIILVDDASTDSTSLVAARHGVRVIRLEQIPRGWHGKPYACHQGALASSGQWLLFTDADTVHAPGGAASAVAYVLGNGLDGLSLLPGQQTRGALDRITLTVAFAALFAGLSESEPVLNGQYILLKRDVYEASGGFSTVADESLEDVALGQHLRRTGYRLPTLWGHSIAQVHMYRDLSTMFHGMARLSSGAIRRQGSRGLLTALHVTAIMSPIIALLGLTVRGLGLRWFLGTWAASTMSILPWSRRFGSPGWALLAPVGALLVQVAAIYGLVGQLLGRGVVWKGRNI
jgi:chlorobactene glucosyltransferase